MALYAFLMYKVGIGALSIKTPEPLSKSKIKHS